MSEPQLDVLTAPVTIEFPFSRTVSRIQGAFLTGLREQKVLGIKRPNGEVLCPPAEYDPETSEALHEMVEVAQTGTVQTWSWCPSPDPNTPVDGPHAWALVQLDGTGNGFLHAVDCGGSPDAMSTGMRVKVRWADEREGAITDIACFEPEEG